MHREQGAIVGIHGGLPELVRIHLPQAFVTLEGDSLAGSREDLIHRLFNSRKGPGRLTGGQGKRPLTKDVGEGSQLLKVGSLQKGTSKEDSFGEPLN